MIELIFFWTVGAWMGYGLRFARGKPLSMPVTLGLCCVLGMAWLVTLTEGVGLTPETAGPATYAMLLGCFQAARLKDERFERIRRFRPGLAFPIACGGVAMLVASQLPAA